MRSVLITGATGFVGSRLAASLAGAGHHVIALVRNPAKTEMLQPAVTLKFTDEFARRLHQPAMFPIPAGLLRRQLRRRASARRSARAAEQGAEARVCVSA
jgi:NAD dependent epimerase/dehydratase family enzyme